MLVGLAVDYAIEFQSRVQERARRERPDAPAAIRRAPRPPTILAAAAAGSAALLVMTLSPVPTVRGFAVLLVVGIGIALLCALTAGSAVLALTGGPFPPLCRARRAAAAAACRSRGASSSPFARACGSALASRRVVRPPGVGRRSWCATTRSAPALPRGARLRRAQPGRVIAVGLAFAALGWALDTQTHVETNLEKLVPQSLASLRALTRSRPPPGSAGKSI